MGFSQQNGVVSIMWTDKAATTNGISTYIIPQFQPEYLVFDGDVKQLYFRYKFAMNAPADKNSLQITNIVYQNISVDQLGDLATSLIPDKFTTEFTSIIARDEFFGLISISPIIKDASGYKKVLSFSYSLANAKNGSYSLPNNATSIQDSKLATGSWYRFYVEKSGVYKISRSFLQNLGMNVNGDPRNIKIFGNGGRMLPLSNAISFPDDPEENAIQIIGEQDGVFDAQDYILFYAEGIDNWSEDSKTHLNLYNKRAYYYITSAGATGKRIAEMTQPSGSATTISTFTDYQFHEKDEINIARVGRKWFGDQFGVTNERTFDFSFPGIVTSAPITLKIYAAASAFTMTNLEVQANGQSAGTMTFGSLSVGSDVLATTNVLSTTISAAENIAIKLSYNNNGVPGSKAFLDYIILQAQRTLKGYGKQYKFDYDGSMLTGIAEFQFSNATAIPEVWNVTDIYNVKKATNPGQSNFSFFASLGDIQRYAVLDNANFLSPSKDNQSVVANQNLKGLIFKNQQGDFADIDYLIITPAFLNAQAEKLANFHRSYSNLNVKVVNLEAIYPEFSTGQQDIAAIRNFVKYVYFNASTPSRKVKYINLFGDGSFDHRNIIPNNTNIVPTYHSANSFNSGETAFVSDDFFALMDLQEGNLETFNEVTNQTSIHIGGIDIAAGRMIVSTVKQADEMVTKVIDYHDKKSYGSWRNNYILIADDADKSSDASLQTRQNELAGIISSFKPFINVDKIFLDAYVQEAAAGGARYPKARQELFSAFEKGALIFNYLGHGGEDGLAIERIWEKVDGQTLSNKYKYPLFITITCEFSRFDNPYRPTAGEYTYWNPNGGAVAMITTVRSISQGSAEIFNNELSRYLLAYDSGTAINEYNSIAESLRRAKNSSSNNSSSNVVFYLGDPALMLAIPKPKIRLTKVNDAPISGAVDDLQALGFVKLSGEITDENNAPLTNYNGQLAVNIFDKEITRTTLNNDGNAPPMTFNILGETVFRGNASVTNGQFEFGFVVPRDIRVPVGNGRISFYAKRNELLLDKTGYDTTIKVGGINANAPVDNVGPTVKLYMNDESFVYGGITNASPFFIAHLEDENGMNTASGIGHDMVAILDGDENNPYIMNDYYETELDNYKKGFLRFPFRNLEKGLHTITFKAWDVYNNPVTAEIQFLVVDSDSVTLTNVLNYPNPFTSYTQFWFTHNRPFEPLDVQIQVMTVTGKVVWTKNQIINTEGFLSREITWDGRDDFGDRIGKGVYIYKLTVKSTLTNTKSEKFEKLVIL